MYVDPLKCCTWEWALAWDTVVRMYLHVCAEQFHHDSLDLVIMLVFPLSFSMHIRTVGLGTKLVL